MSPSTDHDPTPSDAGFSLVEVLVSLVIITLLIVVTLPQLLVGMRSNDVSRKSLQEKGFAQTELERMRNLPFHIAPAAGDFIDVLDRFYPRLNAPGTEPSCPTTGPFPAPKATWAGYVSPSAKHCPWEPPGALYRTVRTETTDPRLRGFVVVLNTQFLNAATPPAAVTPPSDYNSALVGKDSPPTSQIGVTVSVFRTDRLTPNPMTTYAQIGRQDQLEPLIASTLDVVALELGSTTPEGLPLTLSAGLLGLQSSLTYASRASAVISSTTTGIATGQQASGAGTSVQAPPTVTQAQQDQSGASLNASGCLLVCWGNTRSAPLTLSSGTGLPLVGSPATPAQVRITNANNSVITLGAGNNNTDPALSLKSATLVDFDPALGAAESDSDENRNVVRAGVSATCAGTGGDAVRVVSSGWLRTTSSQDTTPYLTEACGVSRAATLSVLPTTFAPRGVIRIRLTDAAVRCGVSGASHAASASLTYSVKVQRWESGAPGGYVTIAEINHNNTSDPLAGVPLTTPLGGGNGLLGDYIESWSSATKNDVRKSTATSKASASVPGIVSLRTVPTRLSGGSPDPLSAVSLTLGSLSCTAEDRR